MYGSSSNNIWMKLTKKKKKNLLHVCESDILLGCNMVQTCVYYLSDEILYFKIVFHFIFLKKIYFIFCFNRWIAATCILKSHLTLH